MRTQAACESYRCLGQALPPPSIPVKKPHPQQEQTSFPTLTLLNFSSKGGQQPLGWCKTVELEKDRLATAILYFLLPSLQISLPAGPGVRVDLRIFFSQREAI